MVLKLRRPILVGGLGLTFGAWLLNSLHPTTTDWSSTVVWGAIALGSGAWWLKQQIGKPVDMQKKSHQPVNRAAVEKTLAGVETRIRQLATEVETASPTKAANIIGSWQQQLAQLTAELERQEFRIAVVGGSSVGKTTLTQLLNLHWGLQLSPELASVSTSDATALLDAVDPVNTADPVSCTSSSLEQNADLVLFTITGDLTSSDFQTLQQLVDQQHRVVLVFNKQDQYLPAERPTVLHQLRERVKDCIPVEDVVAIAAMPAPVKVRQYQPDGSMEERLEQTMPDLSPLTERLGQIVAHHRQTLILQTVQRQALALQAGIQTQLNQLRRDRALPLIEQYQWIAAAAAFANPVPSLDLLATAAINTQLVMDLSGIYQQKFSLDQAKTVTGTLATQMVKLGLVEATTQAIAPLLKSNAITFVAGGLLQGVSAAYLTRLAGLSLIEYFQEQSQTTAPESQFQVERLAQKLKAVFQDNQRTIFLQNLVKQGIKRLTSETPSPALSKVGEA